VWKFRLDFVNLKAKSACGRYWEKTIEKTILRIRGSGSFARVNRDWVEPAGSPAMSARLG
jgi:hypothetical protein